MTPDELIRLADEMEDSLWKNLIEPWFPACVDPKGGFWQLYDRRWRRMDSHVRGVVFQSRMTWVAARLAALPGPRRAEFVDTAVHGMRYLIDTFVAADSGAVRWRVDLPDVECHDLTLQGHAYGAAFAIYALSAVHRSVGAAEALVAAERAFGWLERQLHDAEHGGYFESVDDYGKPILRKPDTRSRRKGDEIGTPYGLKSQNTHLHLLEAFAEMAKSTREPVVIERLEEVQSILQNRLFVADGWLHVLAKPDWTPVPDRISYGHDIEAAHLLLDASETLHGDADNEARHVARALVDHTLHYGNDKEFGGFFFSGNAQGRVSGPIKSWWVQPEALLGLARAAELPGADIGRYLAAVASTWHWIRDRQIDSEFGGWFENVNRDGSRLDLDDGRERKGHMWKAAYHETRGLLETAKILRGMASSQTVG